MDQTKIHCLVKKIVARSDYSESLSTGDYHVYRFVIQEFSELETFGAWKKGPRVELDFGGQKEVKLSLIFEEDGNYVGVILYFGKTDSGLIHEKPKGYSGTSVSDVSESGILEYVEDMELALSRPQNEDGDLRYHVRRTKMGTKNGQSETAQPRKESDSSFG